MRKIINFIVEKRYIVLSIMLALTIAMGFCVPHVKVNFDMTKYLADNSNMKQGLDILNDNFPAASQAQSLRIMFKNIDEKEQKQVTKRIQNVIDELKEETNNDNFGMVNHDNSENFNKNGYSLYMVNTSAPYGSKEIKELENRIRDEFKGKEMYLVSDDPNYEIPLWIMILAVSAVVVILFLMCASWFEPLLFLLVIGLAVLANFGSNIILGTISSVTASISAILQLALSIDYSIILMNRYRQERKYIDDKKEAMKKALKGSVISILSSSLTTIVGLLALVLMNFKIGADLGIVLAKGVFISLLYVLTILPCLIILSDKVIFKSTKATIREKWMLKRALKNKDKKINKRASFTRLKKRKSFSNVMTNFTFRWRNVIMCVFIALFVALFFFQGTTPITFSLEEDDEIKHVFPTQNMVVLIHDSSDNDKADNVVAEIKKGKEKSSVLSYSELLGKPLKKSEMFDAINVFAYTMDNPLPPEGLDILYYMYYDGKVEPLMASELYKQIYKLVTSEPPIVNVSPEMQANIEFLNKLSDRNQLLIPKTKQEMIEFFKPQTMPSIAVGMIFGTKEKMSVQDFVKALSQSLLVPDEQRVFVDMAKSLVDAVVSEKKFTVSEAFALFKNIDKDITENYIKMLYLSCWAEKNSNPEWKLSVHEFVNYLVEKSEKGEVLETFIPKAVRLFLLEIQKMIVEVKNQLTNDDYSLMVITNNLPQEGEETLAFFDNLTKACNDNFNKKFYMVGNSYMNYEMHNNFKRELNIITIATVLVIFIVVALSFKNLSIPLILVSIVQCGVFLTVCSMHFSGVYFLALLIVECILMGATIDYGILFCNYYREHRKYTSVKKAIKNSYKHSIHTVLTSGSILVFATGLIGIFDRSTISQICIAISLGALSAVLLILLVLPSLLIVFDKLVMGKKKGDNKKGGKKKFRLFKGKKKGNNSPVVTSDEKQELDDLLSHDEDKNIENENSDHENNSENDNIEENSAEEKKTIENNI